MAHHITTQEFQKTSETTGAGKAYALVNLRRPSGEGTGETGPLVLNSGVYTDEYVLEGGECLIKSRKLETRLENVITR